MRMCESREKKKKCDKVINSLCFFIGSFLSFLCFFKHYFSFYSSSSHYISLNFPIHSLGIGISRKTTFTHFSYRIFQFSQIHKSTNIPNASFFAVLLLSIFFLFSFNSVKCHILTVCTDTFILFHCILSVKLV